LGAAGAIEAVYSILSLVHQEVYQNLHFKNPVPSTGLSPVQLYENAGTSCPSNSLALEVIALHLYFKSLKPVVYPSNTLYITATNIAGEQY
jgi:3-oxoacyl-(acyl-carrier-protein) synthase